MKKILLILATLFGISSNCTAQWWNIYQEKKDELTGNNGGMCYTCSDLKGWFMMYQEDSISFWLSTKDGIFDKDYQTERPKIVAIGLYDKDMNLIEKLNYISLYETKSPTQVVGKINYPNKSKKYVIDHTKLHKYLLNNDGYVRFVIERYNRSNFDFTIPTVIRWKIERGYSLD